MNAESNVAYVAKKFSIGEVLSEHIGEKLNTIAGNDWLMQFTKKSTSLSFFLLESAIATNLDRNSIERAITESIRKKKKEPAKTKYPIPNL